MVDAKPATAAGTSASGAIPAAFGSERSKIKLFMNRTPSIGALKSKFLTVLGNSNELLNGISNKLTLSTSSSDSDYCDDDDEELPKFDETIDYTKIDFEGRRVKARRAHEEIISGRYRQPNLAPRLRLEHSRSGVDNKTLHTSSSSSSSSCSDSSSSVSLSEHNMPRAGSHVSSTTHSNSIESRHSYGYERNRAIAGARRSDLDIQKDMLRIKELLRPCAETPLIDVQSPTDRQAWGLMPVAATTATVVVDAAAAAGSVGGSGAGGNGAAAAATNAQIALNASSNSMRVPTRSRTSNSSTLTSLRDDPDMQISPSMESTDCRNFIRSESQNSVPSWASSISLDCRTGEEPVKEFMKHFIELLFNNVATIDLELKSEFDIMVRLEIGRQWFTRFLIEQKIKSKCVNELTFHSLVQYFSIVLFECGESEDYAPAAIIMNLCFLFYHEIEVPGCEPYREYLFIFMRRQPIWHCLRFWNNCFHDAVQSEREHRLAARLKRAERRQQSKKSRESATALGHEEPLPKCKPTDSSSSSSHHSNALLTGSKRSNTNKTPAAAIMQPTDVNKEQEDIAFRQLGTFTCNMHALGVPQDMCLEFLKKQMIGLNLSKDRAKLVKDNIHRMYHETELWGSKAL